MGGGRPRMRLGTKPLRLPPVPSDCSRGAGRRGGASTAAAATCADSLRAAGFEELRGVIPGPADKMPFSTNALLGDAEGDTPIDMQVALHDGACSGRSIL